MSGILVNIILVIINIFNAFGVDLGNSIDDILPVTNDVVLEDTVISNGEEDSIEDSVNVYIFDGGDLEIKSMSVPFPDDAKLSEVILQGLKAGINDTSIVIPDYVTIDKVDYNKNYDLVEVYFTQEFIYDMPLGTATEGGFLEALRKTFMEAYNASDINMYFNNSMYTGLKGDVSETQFTGTIFFYNVIEDQMFYVPRTLVTENNQLADSIIEALKQPVDDNFVKLDPNTTVNLVRYTDDTVYVDLSSDYYNSLKNLGSTPEAGLITSICYSFASNYNVNKCALTIDGQPYSSSHYLFGEEELFDFQPELCKPW